MVGQTQPTVSVVVPTRNRAESLERMLRSLGQVNYPRDRGEVIVVDDGSHDATGKLVETLQAEFPFVLRYVYQAAAGVAAARNRGYHTAKGEVIVFVDDDCLFEPGWLLHLVSGLMQPQVGAVGGPDRELGQASFLARCIDWTVTSFVGTGNVRGGRRFRVARYYPRSFNMAARRQALDKVGGFDLTLPYGEDIDLSYRIRKAGYALACVPAAAVWHHRRASLPSFMRQIFIRGATRMELVRRHRGLLEPAYLVPAAIVVLIPLLLGLSWSSQLPWTVTGVLAGAYGAGLCWEGSRAARALKLWRAGVLVGILLLLQHLAYGAGFWRAVISPLRVSARA